MPIHRRSEAQRFETHGSVFDSYVSTARGGQGLCAWRVDVPPLTSGVPHRPSHEEVLVLLSGSLHVAIDAEETDARPGDVVHVPAGARFRIDAGPDGAQAWVTTTAGLTAELPDGSQMAPPWAQ